MKRAIAAILLGVGTAAMAQQSPPVNGGWKACTDVTDQWKAQVDAFNAAHKDDGLQIQYGCMWTNPAPPKPSTYVDLTPSEISHLKDLRRMSALASELQERYEDYLIVAHHLHKPTSDDTCWRYVGIVWDEYRITVGSDGDIFGRSCAK